MIEQSTNKTAVSRDDRILPFTRLVAWIFIPFLVAAFIVLYLDGSRTAGWFAWEIPSRLTTSLMGAGYLGGAYFFLRVGYGRRQQKVHLSAGDGKGESYTVSGSTMRWHHVHLGYAPVTLYSIAMLLATLLHWDKFISTNWPFWIWLVLYIATPLFLPLVWLTNRRKDPRRPEPGERLVPNWLRWLMAVSGAVLFAASVIAFIWPDFFITIWPWTLSPLTARVMAGWHAILGAGAIALASDTRWSAWTVPTQSISIWYGLLLLALFWHQAELGPAGLLNWYTYFVIGGLAGLLIITLIMRLQPRFIA